MDFLTSTLYLLLALTSIRALFSFPRGTKKCPKLPPGPVPLPVIGNLLKLGDKPHQSLAELAKTHGPIMSLKLGRVTVVVISSSAMAKEVLQKQDLAFSNRSIPNALHAHEQYKYSVVWLPVSNRWRSLRKILNSNIFSGNRLDATQELRRRKVAELVEYAQKCSEEGVAMNIGRAGFRTSMNVLSNTIFSEDLADPREDTGKEFKELVWNIMVEAGKPNLVDFFPRVAKMDPQGIRRRMTDYFGSVLELFGGLIDRRLEVRRFRKSLEENDVIDILLNISEENGDEIDRVHIERLCLLTMTTRTALNSVYELIQLLQPLQKEAIKSIGFGGLLELKCTRLPRQLCEWLVGCFDHTSRCLFVHGKRIIITPFDVSHILGLPCEGSIINVNGDHTDIEELSNKYGVKKCGSISLRSLRNELSDMEVDGDDFKGRFVLYILGSLLCPTSELSINRCFLHSLKDMSSLHKLNWSKLVLDFLVDGVRKYKDKGEGKGQRGIRGCLFFLMLFYIEHVTPAVDFVSPCASRQTPRLVYWTDEVIKKRIFMLEKLQYQNNKKVGFIVEDNDVSVEPNINARISNVEKEVKDLRGDLNNLVVGVSQSIESAKEEILIAIAKVANGSWAIEKEKHSHDIDCQLKNEDILDDKWSPPPYAFQDRTSPMDKQLKQENEGLPKIPLGDQFTSSVSPFAPFFSEHELLQPKLPKVILKRSIPVDDGAESSTVLPYHMKLRRESKRKKSKHILSPYDVELGKKYNTTSKQLDMLPKYAQEEATMKNKQVVVFPEQHSRKISELLSMPTPMKGFDLPPLSVEDKLIRDYLFHRSKLESEILINFDIQHGTRKNIWTLDRGCWLDGQIITLAALQFTLKQKDRIPDAKYPAWYLPTYFSQHILQHKVHKPNMLKSYFGTKRYTGKIESCERVYIPINDAGEHWYMCVVYMRQQVVYILDPYISRRSRTRPTQVKKVVEVLHDLLGIQYKNAYTNKITEFPIRTLEWLPQQSNGYDCGMHVIKYFELLQFIDSEACLLQFDSWDARQRLALGLVRDANNKIGSRVIELACDR